MAHAEVEERQLLKAMTWWDGFVVALANPGFLIAALGGSIGALGTTGAFLLWTISICLGALQNNIHAELACMFPNKSGGVALYAHEAWRKYLTLIGPLATFGYWIGWSVVLSVNGLIAGTLLQAEFFSGADWSTSGAGFDLTLPIVIGAGLIVLVWAFNVFGVRPAVWFGYVTGALLCIPAFVLMFLPYITGDWSSSNINFEIGANGGLAIAADATLIAWYTQAFDALVGNFLGGVMIFCVVAGLVLSMNTATMDGSRALYGISKDGMTIRQLGRLNRYNVPALAMTVDAVLNIVLISFFNNPIEIIAVSNIGYVFATCTALSAFLLLRRDRPEWPRPVHLASLWVPLCGALLAANFVFLILGGFIYSGGFLGIEGYGYGWDKTRWGLLVLLIAIGLWAFRHVVQDKQPIRWR